MIIVNDSKHGYLIARAAHTTFDPEIDRVISRCAGGHFLGGVIYTGFTGSMVMMHMAGIEGWVSRHLVWVCFDYPFNQLGVKKVVGTVRSDNRRSVDACEGLGFTLEHAIEDGIPEGVLLIYSMRREACKWLKLRPRYVRGHADALLH